VFGFRAFQASTPPRYNDVKRVRLNANLIEDPGQGLEAGEGAGIVDVVVSVEDILAGKEER
jgi:hypothetical protein